MHLHQPYHDRYDPIRNAYSLSLFVSLPLWWSSIAFSLALILKYFTAFQSISIPALSPSLILFVFIIRPRIISSLACLPCLIQLVLSPSRRFFAYFFPLHPSVAPSISRGLRFVVAEAHEHRLKVGFYITIYVFKKCERYLFLLSSSLHFLFHDGM